MNVCVKVCFGPINPESNCFPRFVSLAPLPDVTVRDPLSLFVQVTVFPALMSIGFGENALSPITPAFGTIDTLIPAAGAGAFIKAFVKLLTILGLSSTALSEYVTTKGWLLNVMKPSALPENGIDAEGTNEFP